MSNSLSNVSIKVAGLGTLIVYGAEGSVDGPVLKCGGGQTVDGQDPPEQQGVYDISSSQRSFTNVTCIDASAQTWTFQLSNAIAAE
ncbi:hypothetical protein LRH25_22620 [Ideonella azotifigens]|uniref:Uncharacterized protein n=1 Tax=Ideonella azotifigens TaxID=513160 RepID=A0ABN1KCS6_9BURK|nr:hypothetical protein [Ideonella azotifigens]MCD2343125.1 hypothetical protein [Ideonella azotifigens]